MNPRPHITSALPFRGGGCTARAAAGFSLVEAVICTLVVAVMLIAALNTLGASRSTQLRLVMQARAIHLADQLLSEVRQQAYLDPQTPGNALGPDGESRGDFDDADDYHGWSSDPPQARDGSTLDAAGYVRQVIVEWVDPKTLTPADADTGLKRVVVTVSFGERELARLQTLRSAGWTVRDPQP